MMMTLVSLFNHGGPFRTRVVNNVVRFLNRDTRLDHAFPRVTASVHTIHSATNFFQRDDHKKTHGCYLINKQHASFSTSVTFEEKDNLHPKSKQAVAELGLSTMTEIQIKSFDVISEGKDVLGRARTGTGKTLSFLLPALQRILTNQDVIKANKNQAPGLEILVISPTRELAIQIHEQAKAILSHHQRPDGKRCTAQVIFGGSSKQQDLNNFNKQLPTILVATPGRLKDHLESSRISHSSTSRSLSDLIRSNVQIVILDEMDRLLDMGFIQDIQSILSHLPPRHQRQTLLFSATLPPQMKAVLESTMKPDYVTIDCIQDFDPATHTNAQVDQYHVIVPARSKWISSTVETILYIMLQSKFDKNTPYKIVAFFPTTGLVSYYADLFNFGFNIQVMELHSRKSQSYRTSVSNRFREISQGILFTSDVSARGVDYPNVTHVIQFGMADGRETYIHRLGRTGRAGKRGRGLLIMTDVEGPAFLQSCVFDLDVAKNREKELDACISMDLDDTNMEVDKKNDEKDISWAVKREAKRLLDPLVVSVQNGINIRLQKAAEDAYRSLLGFYSAKLPALGIKAKSTLVEKVNAFARQAGLNQPPTINRKIATTLGLHQVEGIRVLDEYSDTDVKRGAGRDRNTPRRDVASTRSTMKGRRSPSYDDWGTRIYERETNSVVR